MVAWEALKVEGNGHFKQGDFEQAEESYSAALRALGDDGDREGRVSLLLNKSFALIKQNKSWEACKSALAVVQIDPKNVKGYFRLATALIGVCLYDEAEAAADVGHSTARDQKDKAELEAVRTRAKTLHSNNGKSENKVPSQEQGELALLRNFLLQRRLEVTKPGGALQDEDMSSDEQATRIASGSGASTSRESMPANTAADPADEARQRGTECYKSGDYRSAIEHYTEALRLSPGNVAVLGNRSAAALMLKRYDDVVADCNDIIQLDPAYVKAYARLSKAHLGLSNLAEAVSWAQKACVRDPGNAALKKDLANVLSLQKSLEAATDALARGQATTAMAHAQRAISSNPDLMLAPILLVLGEAQLKVGNSQEAFATGRKLLLNAGSHPKSALMDFHARTLVATGNIPRAVSLYEQLYREDPDSVAVAKALKRVRTMINGKEAGNAAFKAGKYQEAYDQYTRSIEADSSCRSNFTAQVYTNRANVCLKLGKFDDAIADAQLAIDSDGKYGKAYLRKAQAETKLGQYEEAVRSYTKAQEVEPDMAGISDMLETAKRELKKSKRVDYYKLLEVDENCGDADIKKAYRRAALKYHPDKVPEAEREEAEKRFKLLQEANTVLTDSQKRARYDAGWSVDEIENGFRESDMRGPRGCHGHGMSMDDIIFSMFANGGSGGFRGF